VGALAPSWLSRALVSLQVRVMCWQGFCTLFCIFHQAVELFYSLFVSPIVASGLFGGFGDVYWEWVEGVWEKSVGKIVEALYYSIFT